MPCKIAEALFLSVLSGSCEMAAMLEYFPLPILFFPLFAALAQSLENEGHAIDDGGEHGFDALCLAVGPGLSQPFGPIEVDREDELPGPLGHVFWPR
ncbi:hypothetical protein BV509_21060 [Rhodovulum sulfidophilum]|nr:hypothetical protein BV509_21060 [Rhodovulum sulfidophilum]